ncbi:MAG: flagellar hook-length control protein FliK [Chromatiaceae bacterium]|nr:flagellar hook-length control protein FliK [Chromatiaceae bacterium]MCP5315842.1 flagellar hook-length control protein FliK [Chromatiaceae bacterium]
MTKIDDSGPGRINPFPPESTRTAADAAIGTQDSQRFSELLNPDSADGGERQTGNGNAGGDAPSARPDERSPAQSKEEGEQGSSSESGDRKGTKREAEAGATAATDIAGDRILRNILGEAGEVQPQRPAGAEGISELAARIADRILVMEPSSATGSEIRIRLDGPAFRGTEITVNRAHGEISIRLSAPNPAIAQQLQSHAEGLQQAVTARVHAPVRVSVTTESGADGGDNADGRSRNRRDLYQEWKPED